jgi:hypothetical protein
MDAQWRYHNTGDAIESQETLSMLLALAAQSGGADGRGAAFALRARLEALAAARSGAMPPSVARKRLEGELGPARAQSGASTPAATPSSAAVRRAAELQQRVAGLREALAATRTSGGMGSAAPSPAGRAW